VDVTRLRDLVDQILTPGFLDGVKAKADFLLRTNGYPCPRITVEAEPAKESITIRIDPGRKSIFGPVRSQHVTGIDQQILRRYDAFHPGEPYDDTLLQLSSRRISSAGVVQNSHFSPDCSEESSAEVSVGQTFVAGPPRNLTIGFGVDTE